MPEVLDTIVVTVTGIEREDEEEIIVALDFVDDLAQGNILLQAIANVRKHMFFIDGLIGHFITNEECIAFASPFLPAINCGMTCEEVEGQLIGLMVGAASATFKDNVAQVFIHLHATLELPNL